MPVNKIGCGSYRFILSPVAIIRISPHPFRLPDNPTLLSLLWLLDFILYFDYATTFCRTHNLGKIPVHF